MSDLSGIQIALLIAAPAAVLLTGALMVPMFWWPAKGRHRRGSVATVSRKNAEDDFREHVLPGWNGE